MMTILNYEKSIFLLVCLLSFTQGLDAQDKITKHFIGLNPSITAEPFYEDGELDINIFPIVYQRIITKRADFRMTSILNYGIRNDGNKASIYGFEIAAPFFISQKLDKYLPSKGFFFAPVVSIVRYSKEEHTNLGIWFEPGYNFLMDNNFSLSLGVQAGATYFSYDNEQEKWRNHFGIKIVFGKWL
jgi:hypothetical protein